MARTFVYEEIKFQPGQWQYEAKVNDPGEEDLRRFLKSIDAPTDDWVDLYETIQSIAGPKGGRARKSINYHGFHLAVDRKPVPVTHFSEAGRWEVRITLRPPKEGERVIVLPYKRIHFRELWRAAIEDVFAAEKAKYEV